MNVVEDFGFAEIAGAGEIILIDACAVQLSSSERDEYGSYRHTQYERMMYLDLISALFDRIFVTPGVGEEMRLFLKDLESLNMPGRYRRTLRYVLDTITRHEITPTDKEKVHMRELDATLRRFGDGISFQDYEMLMQSLAAADSRSPVSVLTNDIKLVRSFGRMARFLDSRGYMQANTVGIYTKFNGYRFKKGGEYPLSKI